MAPRGCRTRELYSGTVSPSLPPHPTRKTGVWERPAPLPRVSPALRSATRAGLPLLRLFLVSPSRDYLEGWQMSLVPAPSAGEGGAEPLPCAPRATFMGFSAKSRSTDSEFQARADQWGPPQGGLGLEGGCGAPRLRCGSGRRGEEPPALPAVGMGACGRAPNHCPPGSCDGRGLLCPRPCCTGLGTLHLSIAAPSREPPTRGTPHPTPRPPPPFAGRSLTPRSQRGSCSTLPGATFA